MSNSNSTQQKIIWLASYPKSGNTWLRAFFSALIQNEVDVNQLIGKYVLHYRPYLHEHTAINTRYLFPNEIIEYQKASLASDINKNTFPFFIKTHDLFDTNLVNRQNTYHIIYIVRHPFAVCSSLAHFRKKSIEDTILYMNNPQATIGKKTDGLNTNRFVEQKLNTWSENILSWVTQTHVPISIIRYEDMYQTPLKAFSKLIHDLKMDYSEKKIQDAIQKSSFQNLKNQEQKNGFWEKPNGLNTFFREGQLNIKNEELKEQQKEIITQNHGKVMRILNYL